MSAVAAAVMNSAEGQPIALQGVAVEAQLRDLLSEVTVTQTYRNTETVNIEAVYSFPLPLEATLLDLSVTLGERRLRGRVVEKGQAEERYEEAADVRDRAEALAGALRRGGKLAIMAATYEGSVLPMDKALDVESKYFTQLFEAQ